MLVVKIDAKIKKNWLILSASEGEGMGKEKQKELDNLERNNLYCPIILKLFSRQ